MHRAEIPPGPFHRLIVEPLARCGGLRGYEIGNWFEQVSEKVLQVEGGSRGRTDAFLKEKPALSELGTSYPKIGHPSKGSNRLFSLTH